MPLFLLTCELTRSRDVYAGLREALDRESAVQVFETSWLFRSPQSAVRLLEAFRDLVQAGDRLIVAQLSDSFAWSNPMGDPSEV